MDKWQLGLSAMLFAGSIVSEYQQLKYNAINCQLFPVEL